jgi:hypothetical protein
MKDWVEDVLYVPTGVRGDGRDHGKGETWMDSLRNGQWERIYNVTRLHKHQFESLLDWLLENGLKNTNHCTPAEKLLVDECCHSRFVFVFR